MTLFEVADVRPHPATYSDELKPYLARTLRGRRFVCDPFAGAGGIHELADAVNVASIGVELEPEWAARHPRTIVGDALHLPFADATFDTACTSPTYGNRMADRDLRPTVAGTYAKSLGRHASPGSSCHLQWGSAYRAFHEHAWAEALRVLEPGGRFVLNISDHYRNRELQPVTAWHVDTFEALGCVVLDRADIATRRLRNGANEQLRAETEAVVVFEARR